ncbi:MAG: hypothetical protein WCO60_08940 [Verrucomicrobiota bacterium]
MKLNAHFCALALLFAESGHAQSPNTSPPAPLLDTKIRATQAKAMNEARNIAMAIRKYANEHNGVFPHTLESLFTSGTLSQGTSTTVENPLLKQLKSWMYDSSLTDAGSGRSIMLASRSGFKTNEASVRLVVYADGSTAFISESEFELQKGPSLK